VFLAKSAEEIENKRVEFLTSAKMCKRVRKSVKRKGIGGREWGIGRKAITGASLERQPRCKVGAPPPVFFVSVASKGLSPAVSLLFAAFTGEHISVASKELKEEGARKQ
jgi:hypothetical protein